MSALAQQHQAINLSQGFLILMVRAICRSGWRTMLTRGKPIRAYDWRAGLARGDCSEKERLYGYQPDADSDITVTAGGRKRYMQRLPHWCAMVMK